MIDYSLELDVIPSSLTAPLGDDSLTKSLILIIDDEQAGVELLSSILVSHGFPRPIGLTDPRQALSVFLERHPDIVVLDLIMPHLDGYTLAKQIRARIPDGEYLPILVLTGDSSRETKRKLLAAGADDFLTKPYDSIEVLLRIRHLLEIRLLHNRLRAQNQELEEKVRQRTLELEEAQEEILQRLALTAEHRDDNTAQHTHRVALLTERLALACGLAPEEARLIGRAAILHDLGKVAISDAVLRKPGQLLPEEFETVKPHTVIGAGILAGSRSKVLQIAEIIALYHHERWDGQGYAGLQGEAIPLPARLVALADAFDAMTHDRPYRPARNLEEAIAECRAQSGRHFDPRLVEALNILYASSELESFI
jgi:putative two-component system response regulator